MLQEISIFLLRTFANLFVIVLLLRLFMQIFRANFRNPLAQAIVQLTSPLIVPVRRVVPAIGKIDTATVLVAYVFEVIFLVALLLILGVSPQPSLLFFAAVRLVLLSIHLYTFAIIISVVLSWIAPGTYNPAAALLHDIVDPVLKPFRRFVPLVGGLDLSPLLALIALQIGNIIVSNLLPIVLR